MADIEGVRDAIAVDLASAGFTAVLDAVYAEKGETVLNYPAEIHRGQRWSPQQFPCAEVVVVRARVQQPDVLYVDDVAEVTIFWHVNGLDETRIDTEVMRLVRATKDFYSAKPNLLPTLAEVTVWQGDDDYSPLLNAPQSGQPYLKSGALTMYAGVRR